MNSVVWVYLLPSAVFAVAAGLLFWQRNTWRSQQQGCLEADLEFARGQFRRRTQTSAILAVLALGMCLGQLIPRREQPTLFVLFWVGMLLLLAWMVLLALGDLVIGRQHVARLVQERRTAESQLQAELDRLRAQRDQEAAAKPDTPHPQH